MANPNDISGQRFGRLVAIRSAGKQASFTLWECQCDCGNVSRTIIPRLRSGKTKSCGCLRAEATRARRLTHGLTESGTYNSWMQMIQRCTNPKDSRWTRYGGRGIRVHGPWLTFANFLADMGEKPPEHSIDRIDNDGNYEPANCRWASQKTQQNNRSTNRILTINGRSQSVTRWAEELGIKSATLSARLRKGWAPIRAVSTPVRPRLWGRPNYSQGSVS
jgi:hypothetical protein